MPILHRPQARQAFSARIRPLNRADASAIFSTRTLQGDLLGYTESRRRFASEERILKKGTEMQKVAVLFAGLPAFKPKVRFFAALHRNSRAFWFSGLGKAQQALSFSAVAAPFAQHRL
jgi:hypothetical protein